MRTTALFFVVVFLEASALAATYYVNNGAAGASDGNPGTLASPWLTIQHAADTAAAGDTVIVKPGIYPESIKLSRTGTATAPITFKGEKGAVVDGSSLDPWSNGFVNLAFDPAAGYETWSVVDFIDIEGFEIRSFWRGIYAEPAFQKITYDNVFPGGNGWVMKNNVIHDCYEGISVWSTNSPEDAYIITGNYLYNNTWTDIHTHRYSVVARNVTLSHATSENIRACTAYYLPGAIHAVNNNTVLNGTYGIGVSYPGSEYKNNIVMNIKPYSYIGWDGQTYSSGGYAFLNRLFYVNMELTTVNISYNDLFNNYSNAGDWSTPLPLPSNVVGNISADPLFVNNTGDSSGDYHLTAGSPCIDAGDPADPVPAGGGSRIDIGAYEYLVNIPALINEKHLFYSQGLINNKGIVTSLDAKLNAATASLARGQVKTAQNQLKAFIHEAEAQSGKHVDAGAAQALIDDAKMVLKAIEQMQSRTAKKR